jgi:hypothetical protein
MEVDIGEGEREIWPIEERRRIDFQTKPFQAFRPSAIYLQLPERDVL